MSTYFCTVINEKAADLLRSVIATGLYGESETEVVGYLLLKGVQEAVANGFVKLPEPEEEDPEAQPAAPLHVKCEHCDDGFKAISDETPEGNCPKCGALVEIPF